MRRPKRGVIIGALAFCGAGGLIVIISLSLIASDSDDSSGGSTPSEEPEFADIVGVARGAGVGNPRRPELPDPDESEPTVVYLASDGGALLELHQMVLPLVDRAPPTNEQCRAVATALDELGSPTELYSQGQATPDPVLSDMFVSLSASTGRFLGACDAGDEQQRGELAYQWVLVQRRLDQLGVTA